jgi:preprotein translocase subunit SecG
MQTVIIVIHLMVVVALVGVVLLQRSEGGGLGIGGGSGFMTARGAANALTRTTAILAAVFFATSLALSVISRYQGGAADILDNPPPASGATKGAPAGGEQGKGILDQLGGAPATKPSSSAPAADGGVPTGGGAPASNGSQGSAPAQTAPAAPTTTPMTPTMPLSPAEPPAPATGGNGGTAQPQVPNR